MSRRGIAGLALGISLFLASPARANTPEDILGLSARVNAMGGAGTGISDDFSAVYYNPANLAFCPTKSFSLDLGHTAYALGLEAGEDDPDLEALRDQTRSYVGFCTDLPYGLAFGIAFGMGLQHPMTLDQHTLEARPQYLLYGEPLEQLSIMLGVAWRFLEEVSIGVGVAILIDSGLVVDAGVPAVGEGEVRAGIHWDLQPVAAPYVGVRWSPIEQLDLAATYRSALFHDLDANAFVEVEVAGVLLDVDLLLESAAWYSPQQLALGGAAHILPELTIAADVTWYDWSEHPGPFVVASPEGDDPASIAAALRYAPREDFGFRDVWVPRLGVEYELLDGAVAVRGGFQHRPSPAPAPSGRSNLLDDDTTVLSLGGGYRWGDAPDRNRFEPPFGAEPTEPEGATSGTGMNGRVDVVVRAHLMGERHVVRSGEAEQEVLNDYRFGGEVFDAGVTLTVGWW